MAPVFVLLQEVEGKRGGGGPPRGPGTVTTRRARSCHGHAAAAAASRLLSQAARRARDEPADADGGSTLTGRWFPSQESRGEGGGGFC